MLSFWESEPQYAYKRYAYKKQHVCDRGVHYYKIQPDVGAWTDFSPEADPTRGVNLWS